MAIKNPFSNSESKLYSASPSTWWNTLESRQPKPEDELVGYDPASPNGDSVVAVAAKVKADGTLEVVGPDFSFGISPLKNAIQAYASALSSARWYTSARWHTSVIYYAPPGYSIVKLTEKLQSVKPEFIGSSTDKHPLHTGVGYRNSEQVEVPDCVMPLTGYRVWWPYDILSSKYFRDGLTSIAYNEYKLTPAKAEKANCLDYWDDSGKDKVCPDENCFCGYYSFKSLDVLLHQSVELMPRAVIGIVDVWGKVIEHELGYRSQYIYPRELWLLSPDQEYLGEMYGVPVRKAY